MNIDTNVILYETVIVKPEGRVDAFTAPKLRRELEGHSELGFNHFVIDLTDIEFLDSAGMAALISQLKRSRANDGDVKLVWPRNEAARRILHLTKFDRVFDMLDSAEVSTT